NHVREIEKRRDRCSADETELHARREPSCLARRQTPPRGQLRRHGAGGEPQRHPKQLRGREKRESPPASLVLIARCVDGRRHATPSMARPTDSRSPATARSAPACITTTRSANAKTSSRSLE